MATNIFNTQVTPIIKFENIELQELLSPVWVNANVDGTSDVSYNVSSLTDIGAGNIGVNFIVGFTNTNYITIGTAQTGSSIRLEVCQTPNNLSSTVSNFAAINSAAALADPTEWNLLALGVLNK